LQNNSEDINYEITLMESVKNTFVLTRTAYSFLSVGELKPGELKPGGLERFVCITVCGVKV
jgi:hypothetical protein